MRPMTIVMLTTIGFLLVSGVFSLFEKDREAIIDFIAPTAAQARDNTYTAIVEAL